jgi:L-threonylcarbamoyladenylate synthase
MIHDESLKAALGGEIGRGGPAGTLRSPGLLPRHYSPRARLKLLDWTTSEELEHRAGELGIDRARAVVIAHTQLPRPDGWAGVSIIPHDAEAYARALYAEWHRCDQEKVDWIVMEAVPDQPEWRGIADRLRRAATA